MPKDNYIDHTPFMRQHAIRRNLPRKGRYLHAFSFPDMGELTKVEPNEANDHIGKNIENHFMETPRKVKSWFGVESRAELDECLYKGHPARMKQIQGMANDIAHVTPKVKGTRRKVSKESQGDELDIHAMRRGDLQAWRRMRKVESPKDRGRARAVKICISLAHGALTTADQMAIGPAAGLALAQKLCAHGIAVEIWGYSGSYGYLEGPRKGKDLFVEVCLKRRNVPFSLARLSLASVAALERYYMFRAACTGPAASMGMGSASTRGSQERESNMCNRDKTVKTIVCPRIRDTESAAAWVQSQLEGVL